MGCPCSKSNPRLSSFPTRAELAAKRASEARSANNGTANGASEANGTNSNLGVRFNFKGPTQQGELTACMTGGWLYRIVLPDGWFFYNDTDDYEFRVSFAFGDDATAIAAVPPAVSARDPDDNTCVVVSVVVNPGETVPFLRGHYSGKPKRFEVNYHPYVKSTPNEGHH